MLKRLLSYVGEYKKYAFLTPVIMIGEVAMEILIPFVMSKIVDIGIANGDAGYVVRMGILMIFMALFSLTCGVLGAKTASFASCGFAKNIRKRLFDKVQDFSFANVDTFSTGSLITRLTTDVNNTQNAFMQVIRSMVRSPFMFIGGIIMTFYINASLALVFVVAVPVLLITVGTIMTKAHPRFKVMLEKYDKLNAKVQEALTAVRVIKSYVREGYETEEFDKAADSVRRAQVRAEKLVVFNMPIVQMTMYASIIAVLWLGGNQVIVGGMKTGELISFVSYVTQTLSSLMMLSMMFMMLIISFASVRRISEVLDENSDIINPDTPITQVKDGSIEFKNVHFSYYKDINNTVLKDINLKIKSGETIGIIGGTGSSKTSLVQLIPRLYDVTDGEVLVGGCDVRDYDLKTLRDNVAMVLQKNVLFSGTIRDNLKWGRENATDEEIINACKSASAHDFVMSFPDGYDTWLGQGGVNVSGGQKQRLCIARALLKNPKIIILDDSTSAVDTATDSKIRQAFREDLKDTTTIIIAQRISSVCDADRIVVIDDGRIDAVGTHDELLKTNAIYQEVYISQQQGTDDSERGEA